MSLIETSEQKNNVFILEYKVIQSLWKLYFWQPKWVYSKEKYTKTIDPFFSSWKKCLTGRKAYVIIKVSPENLCILWKMVVWVNWIFCYERYLFEHVFPVVRSVFCWFVWWCYSIVLKYFFIYIRSYSNVHMFTPFSPFLVDWIHECAALSCKWNANTVYWWSKLTTKECLESKMKKKKTRKENMMA